MNKIIQTAPPKIKGVTTGIEFEVWHYNGIPADEPEFKTTSLQYLRNWLGKRVYMDFKGEICGSEGATVFCNDKEIPLEAIFSADEFYSSKEWAEIVGI